MYFSLDELLHLLETYKYLVLFPLAILEGPIVTLTAGFLISVNYFNATITYVIILLGDSIGDALHYYAGNLLRHRKAISILNFLRVDERKLKLMKTHFEKHPKKSILFSKFAPGVGGTIQVVAGVAEMPFWQFMWLSIIGTIPKSLLLLTAGYLFGNNLKQIDNYFSIGGAVLLFVAITLIIIYLTFTKYIEKEYEN
jgi:membrane protein DedA with SNARE-associated domain